MFPAETEEIMIKVASYCRVSTDRDDQANSFQTQKAFFREYIQRNRDWELYAVYADEGITGTSTKKRKEFNRMMNDACEGRFRMILTKEVSRFSRNILDTIAYTRELKRLGIAVLFLNDGINTLDPDAELRLSIMASIAQEESRRTSERVVWGQTRQMEKGVVFGHSLLGYDVRDGHITVNPEGAEIVRLIFHKYAVEQVGTSEIARFLTREGCRTYRGSRNWNPGTVIKILKNEKYVGDLVQKKTYTPDFLSHEKKSNKGAVPLITIPDHHEPIISREVWNLAQERLRNNNKHAAGESGHSNRYVFSGKIKCGQCGSSFVGRIKYLKDGTGIRRWCCGKAAREGTAGCDIGKLIRDDDALEMLKTALRSLPVDANAVISSVTELALEAILMGRNAAGESDQIQQELVRTQHKKDAVMDAYFSREIEKEDMIFFTAKYDQELSELQNRLKEAQTRRDSKQDPAELRSQIKSEVMAILQGETESEVFYKTMLHSLTVFTDRHLELRLNHLHRVFYFV